LPGAPPFVLRQVTHVGGTAGAVGFAGLDVVVSGRGASASTLFGTLLAPGFVMVDLIGRYPLSPAVGIKATVENAFDVTDARDSNLLPLPGRLFFVALEVHT
jgi:outer membrane receptor protein involved in Fe transport